MELPLGPDSFACGSVRFIDTDSSGDVRIVIPVRFAGGEPILAIVDSGAPYSILAPDQADALNIDLSAENSYETNILTRLGKVRGSICRVPVELMADEGTGAGFDEASVFIPSDPWMQWPPDLNFIGLQNLLFRIRFAVDPHPDKQLFYFSDPF